MSSRHNPDPQKFKDAGEQAARVIGEFMSIADDFSKRFENFSAKSAQHSDGRSFNDRERYTESKPTSEFNSDRSADVSGIDVEEEWRKAGDYLRELREAAGYTVDGFAKAMNRHNAAETIKSVEDGRDVFPSDWLDQVSALLKQNDPLEFFEKLRSHYESENRSANDEADTSTSAATGTTGNLSDADIAVRLRKEKLVSIFSEEHLETLSDSQFEELLEFVRINYNSGLKLVRNK